MKKLLFIIALTVTSMGYAQSEITPEQLENTRRTTERVNQFNAEVDQEVNTIMTAGQLNANKKGEVQEIVAQHKIQIAKINRNTISNNLRDTQIAEVETRFENQLKRLLGKRYSAVKSALSSN